MEIIFEFSRHHCVAICAFLIPATILTTLSAIVFLLLQRPISQIRTAVGLSTTLALTIILHVSTWLAVGIVTPVSFILTGLGATCLIINFWVINYPVSLEQLLQLAKSTIAKQLALKA